MIIEPTFAPAPLLAVLFWVKRLIALVTKSRVPIGGHWNNIGAPVVSFYRPDQVRRMAEHVGTIEVFEAEPERLGRLPAAILTKTNTTVVVRTPVPER